jgi:hypothetical protein
VSDQAAAYLVRQKEGQGIWRYRGKGDRVPPDVEDTAMAWVTLKRCGQSIPSEVFDILRASRNQAGLFNTWIGDPATWTHIDSREIDAVINANALLFFKLNGEEISEVCDYLGALVENNEFSHGSVYYPSQLAFTHALSRAYADGGVKCLEKTGVKIRAITLSLQESDGGWGDDYETALGVLTLLNLGEKGAAVDRAMALLASRQQADGGWKLATIYTGALRLGVGRLVYGSREVVTALCIEAFAKYLRS